MEKNLLEVLNINSPAPLYLTDVPGFSQGSGSILEPALPCSQGLHWAWCLLAEEDGLTRAVVSPPPGSLALSGLVSFIVMFQSFMKSVVDVRFQTYSKHNCRGRYSFCLALGSCSAGIIICITPTLKIQVISDMSLSFLASLNNIFGMILLGLKKCFTILSAHF